ncbi:hypothetical protein D3C79_680890 [compost metagenome]
MVFAVAALLSKSPVKVPANRYAPLTSGDGDSSLSVPVPVVVVLSGLTRVNWPLTNEMFRPVAPSPSAPADLLQKPYCARTLPVPIRLPNASAGPSSLITRFCPMLRVAWALSPSLSVLVAVRVTRLSALRLFESSGLVASGWITARSWSRVTSPLAATLTVNTSWLVVAVRPSTTPLLSDRFTASLVAVSVSPEAPATTPSA